ncbi:hypothetical protein [Ammoniphilus resinae]|uniref:Antitoxin Xre/MbcA/ParS-like toxin-binding domain-containing protein n=1 Tax=Ammoniphilus resinae TaxID=861532 RepID=A0ABS4GX94_9BACL|nr:hypothetical protein [Ammoniphilus resinae]MBP1934893.1 hypothetical protein [Ammoniphilus resinae]
MIIKNSLFKRVERIQKAFGPSLVEESKKKQYRFSIDEWTDDEIKDYFFNQPEHLVSKARETDWEWVNDDNPGGRLRTFLKGCSINELKELERLLLESEVGEHA